jgi:hypothetical protein
LIDLKSNFFFHVNFLKQSDSSFEIVSSPERQRVELVPVRVERHLEVGVRQVLLLQKKKKKKNFHCQIKLQLAYNAQKIKIKSSPFVTTMVEVNFERQKFDDK